MVLENKAANYKELRHNAAGAKVTGTITLIEDTYAFPITDLVAAEVGAYIYESEKVEGPKSAVTIKEGEAVYWDNGGPDTITNVAGALPLIGFCIKDAALADANVLFHFDGKAAFLKA